MGAARYETVVFMNREMGVAGIQRASQGVVPLYLWKRVMNECRCTVGCQAPDVERRNHRRIAAASDR